MSNNSNLVFPPAARRAQAERGSARQYEAKVESGFPDRITPELAAKAQFMRGKGCGNCQRTGYRGRLGIFELMLMTNKVREVAFQGSSTQDIRKVALAAKLPLASEDTIFDGVAQLKRADPAT